MTTQDPTPTRKPSELARLSDIYRIGTDRADEAADTLQDAFAADPFIGWLLEGCASTQEQWYAKHQQYWLWCCQNLLPTWELHALGDFSAVALWYPLPEEPPPKPESSESETGVETQTETFEQMSQRVMGDTPRHAEFLQVLKQCHEVMHAAVGDQPAWYLAAVGVKSSHKGQGLGSRLLDKMLARCDRLGQPAYLESSSQRNLPLYERLGFERLAEPLPSVIEAPGGSEPLVPMLRPPTPAKS